MTILDPTYSIAVPTEPIFRLTLEQYHQMIASGILTEDSPVELLEGWLVTKMPKNRRHSIATQQSRDALAAVLPTGWFIDVQEPITLPDESEPEPDLIIIQGQRRDFLDRHPGPAHIGLVVEVSDATLMRDRGLKKRLYARAGIPLYWIINLVEQQVQVFSQPASDDYDLQAVYQMTDSVPLVLDDQPVAQISARILLG